MKESYATIIDMAIWGRGGAFSIQILGVYAVAERTRLQHQGAATSKAGAAAGKQHVAIDPCFPPPSHVYTTQHRRSHILSSYRTPVLVARYLSLCSHHTLTVRTPHIPHTHCLGHTTHSLSRRKGGAKQLSAVHALRKPPVLLNLGIPLPLLSLCRRNGTVGLSVADGLARLRSGGGYRRVVRVLTCVCGWAQLGGQEVHHPIHSNSLLEAPVPPRPLVHPAREPSALRTRIRYACTAGSYLVMMQAQVGARKMVNRSKAAPAALARPRKGLPQLAGEGLTRQAGDLLLEAGCHLFDLGLEGPGGMAKLLVADVLAHLPRANTPRVSSDVGWQDLRAIVGMGYIDMVHRYRV